MINIACMIQQPAFIKQALKYTVLIVCYYREGIYSGNSFLRFRNITPDLTWCYRDQGIDSSYSRICFFSLKGKQRTAAKLEQANKSAPKRVTANTFKHQV
jgi:hypothetical protein